jgi:hypothetical protein
LVAIVYILVAGFSLFSFSPHPALTHTRGRYTQCSWVWTKRM